MPLLSTISKSEETWRNQLFVTTDIDWACDEVIEYCYNFFESLNINVTWFGTHETKWNKKISENKNFEIGSHPNFNNILFNNLENCTPNDIIIDNIKIISKTNLVRSHSTTISSPLLELFNNHGLTIESNLFVPYNSGIIMKPFLHYNGILRVPYIWSDDVHMAYGWNYKDSINGIISYNGARVIDCHPIHIFLNSENLERYNAARPYLKNIDELKKFANNSNYGVRNFIIDLVKKYNESSNNR